MSVRKTPRYVFGCFHPKSSREITFQINNVVDVAGVEVSVDISNNGVDVSLEGDVIGEMKDICAKLKRVNTLELLQEESEEDKDPKIEVEVEKKQRKKKIEDIKTKRKISLIPNDVLRASKKKLLIISKPKLETRQSGDASSSPPQPES